MDEKIQKKKNCNFNFNDSPIYDRFADFDLETILLNFTPSEHGTGISYYSFSPGNIVENMDEEK